MARICLADSPSALPYWASQGKHEILVADKSRAVVSMVCQLPHQLLKLP